MAELSALAMNSVAPADSAALLAKLRARPRRPGEASFFWCEPQLRSVAVKILPGEYFVSREEMPIMTTLGSCIASCLWDRVAHVGGMNHFMLSDGAGDNGRYGAFAMEQLINELLKLGATRSSLEAKVFGGGQVLAGMDSLNVGERNTLFVLDYLRTERIPVVSKDVMDIYPRKVCFLPCSGKAMVKRLAPTQAAELVERERTGAPRAAATGSVDLF
jgi:chemotaxis protein CheD